MITPRLLLAVALAVPAAGFLVAPSATAAPAVPHATAAHHAHGHLTKKERKDHTTLASTGATTVTFRGSCDTVKVTLRGAGTRRVSSGDSPLTLAGVGTSAAKVTIAKPSTQRTCTATWSARTAVTTAAYRRPKPTPTPTATKTPTPTPTATKTPTPTPTTASPTPTPTTASPTPTTASPTPTTASPTPTTPTGGNAVTPQDFGAVGDGVTDDTAALQKAFNSLTTGDTLTLPAGAVYRHTAVLKVSVPGVTITGSGTLLATAEATSAVYLAADGITLDGPTLTMGTTTQRWVAYEQMKLRLGRFDGITVRNVTINGSAAAGLYVGGSTHFAISDVTVNNTRADAIHMTTGAAYGTVTNAKVVNPGDDGVAVVSYTNDGARVHDITVNNPRVEGQKWGRGLSVVGGYNVTYNNAYVSKSAGACIYIAAESEFNTYGVDNVTVNGAQLLGCNQQADVDAADRPTPTAGRVVHGAIMVYNSQAGATISNITMKNLIIKDTHPDGYDQVKLNNAATGSITRTEFTSVAITGGSKYLFKAMGTPATAYRLVDWTKEGVAVADQLGW